MTVLGPNHSPTDFPSATPVLAETYNTHNYTAHIIELQISTEIITTERDLNGLQSTCSSVNTKFFISGVFSPF